MISAGNRQIGLYNVPERIASIESEGDWELGDAFARIEREFRPHLQAKS